MSGCGRVGPLLDGYHDGELGTMARLRVHRHLARCPECRDDVGAIARLGDWLRDASDGIATPDLWAGIAARLPQRGAAAAGAARRARRVPRPWRLAIPVAGLVGAAAVAGLAVWQPSWTAWRNAFGPAVVRLPVVRSLDAHGRPVIVLDGAGEGTVIWLMDGDGGFHPEEASSVWI